MTTPPALALKFVYGLSLSSKVIYCPRLMKLAYQLLRLIDGMKSLLKVNIYLDVPIRNGNCTYNQK